MVFAPAKNNGRDANVAAVLKECGILLHIRDGDHSNIERAFHFKRAMAAKSTLYIKCILLLCRLLEVNAISMTHRCLDLIIPRVFFCSTVKIFGSQKSSAQRGPLRSEDRQPTTA